MAAISFKRRHFQQDMIRQRVRWYLAYSLSYRDIEELMQERGFSVDHSTINRWVIHYSPQLEAAFRFTLADEQLSSIRGWWVSSWEGGHGGIRVAATIRRMQPIPILGR